MKRKMIVYSFLSVAALTAVTAVWMYNRPRASVGKSAPAFKLSAAHLAGAYERDENEANSLYTGKVLEVEGTLKEVTMSEGTVTLTMAGNAGMTGVTCYLEDGGQERYRGLKAGKTIRVKGVCNGYLLDVVLDNCILLTAER